MRQKNIQTETEISFSSHRWKKWAKRNLTRKETKRTKTILQSIFSLENIFSLWIIYQMQKYQVSPFEKCEKSLNPVPGSQRNEIFNFCFRQKKSFGRCLWNTRQLTLCTYDFVCLQCTLYTTHTYSVTSVIWLSIDLIPLYVYLYFLVFLFYHCSFRGRKEHPITAICFIPIPRHPFVVTWE